MTDQKDLTTWKGTPRPDRKALEGHYARLEPLDPARHGADLLASAQAPGGDERFRYLFEEPPADLAAFTPWLQKAAASEDPLFFAVIDKRTGRAEGRQALMRIDTVHGVIEIGNILWGPAIARTQVATEASLPAMSSTTSAIAVSNGNATTATSPRSAQHAASVSPSKASSASTW